MDETGLKNWLVLEKNFGKKSAGDVVSRCRRIERILEVSLDTLVNTPKGLQHVTDWLKKESSIYLKPDVNKVYAVAVLRRAATLYSEYLAIQKT